MFDVLFNPFRWKATEENVPVTADSQLIIHDIPIEASRQDLLKCFSTFGGITSLRIDDKGRVGFLTFSSAEAAKLALQSSPHQISGKYLRVSLVKLRLVHEMLCGANRLFYEGPKGL